MTPLGFNKHLYILPFDHRGSSRKNVWLGRSFEPGTDERDCRREGRDLRRLSRMPLMRVFPKKRPASWWTSSSEPTFSRRVGRRLPHRLPRGKEQAG